MNLSNLSGIVSNVTALIVRPSGELSLFASQSDEIPLTNNSRSVFNSLADIWRENCASSANELMTQTQASLCDYIESSMEEIEAINREDETGVTSSALIAVGAGLGLGILASFILRQLLNYRQRQTPAPPQ